MRVKAYRGTKDVLPILLDSYYDGGTDYYYGKGMYFAQDIKLAESYGASSSNKFGIVCCHQITVKNIATLFLEPKSCQYYSGDKKINELAKKMLHINNFKGVPGEMQELLTRREDAIKHIDSNYDAVVGDDMFVLKNQSCSIDIISFDVYFKEESVANKVYHDLKIGEYNGSSIKGIPGEYKDRLSLAIAANIQD